jgi:hypothetical protein
MFLGNQYFHHFSNYQGIPIGDVSAVNIRESFSLCLIEQILLGWYIFESSTDSILIDSCVHDP